MNQFAFTDLTGRRFGLLVAMHRVPVGRRFHWSCRCDCGNIKTLQTGDLNSGKVRSCGCLRTINPLRFTPEYRAWQNMRTRCTNPNDRRYHRYGGRGIAITKRWLHSFAAFYTDMGPKPSLEYTLERKNNNRGYSKRNCKWATQTEQAANKEITRRITHRGMTLCASEWSRRATVKMSRGVFYHRIFDLGWKIEKALTTPVRTLSLSRK